MSSYEVCVYDIDPVSNPKDAELWGCPIGADCDSEEEAEFYFLNPDQLFGQRNISGCWVGLKKDNVLIKSKPIPGEKIVKDDKTDDAIDNHWKREQAMEAGMCLGIDAYNDIMGY